MGLIRNLIFHLSCMEPFLAGCKFYSILRIQQLSNSMIFSKKQRREKIIHDGVPSRNFVCDGQIFNNSFIQIDFLIYFILSGICLASEWTENLRFKQPPYIYAIFSRLQRNILEPNSLKCSSIQMVHSIELKFGMYIIGHRPTYSIDFDEFRINSFFTGEQKRILIHCSLQNQSIKSMLESNWCIRLSSNQICIFQVTV